MTINVAHLLHFPFRPYPPAMPMQIRSTVASRCGTPRTPAACGCVKHAGTSCRRNRDRNCASSRPSIARPLLIATPNSIVALRMPCAVNCPRFRHKVLDHRAQAAADRRGRRPLPLDATRRPRSGCAAAVLPPTSARAVERSTSSRSRSRLKRDHLQQSSPAFLPLAARVADLSGCSRAQCHRLRAALLDQHLLRVDYPLSTAACPELADPDRRRTQERTGSAGTAFDRLDSRHAARRLRRSRLASAESRADANSCRTTCRRSHIASRSAGHGTISNLTANAVGGELARLDRGILALELRKPRRAAEGFVNMFDDPSSRRSSLTRFLSIDSGAAVDLTRRRRGIAARRIARGLAVEPWKNLRRPDFALSGFARPSAPPTRRSIFRLQGRSDIYELRVRMSYSLRLRTSPRSFPPAPLSWRARSGSAMPSFAAVGLPHGRMLRIDAHGNGSIC